jgi:hypothetical protein
MDPSLRDENEIVLRDGSTIHVRSTSPDETDLLSAPLAGVRWRRRLCARLALMHRVGPRGGDAVVIAHGRAGVPAVANLLVLVDQREVFALVGLRLDAADLVRPFGSWSRRSALSAADSRRPLDPQDS